MRNVPAPSRDDIWMVDLDPTWRHEQSGSRPALVVSVDAFDQGSAGLVVVLPITSTVKGIPFHMSVAPLEGGLTFPIFVKCEDVRPVSEERPIRRLGMVSAETITVLKTACVFCWDLEGLTVSSTVNSKTR